MHIYAFPFPFGNEKSYARKNLKNTANTAEFVVSAEAARACFYVMGMPVINARL